MNEEQKKDNILLNLCCNIIIPVIILSKFSKPEYLGAMYGLIVALCFPLGYGIYFYLKTKKTNFISILGFVSILLTGMIGVLNLPSEWIAYERAMIPFLIGAAVLASLKTKYPLVRTFLYNETMFDVKKIDQKLNENGNTAKFEKQMTKASVWLAVTFFLSAIINFVVAKIVVIHETGTPEFNAELAKMKLISLAVVAIPSTVMLFVILQRLLKSLHQLSGIEMDDLYSEQLRSKMK